MTKPYKIAITILLFAYLLGCKVESKEESWKFAEALPGHITENCLTPNSREMELFDAAAKAIELTSPELVNPLEIGAEQLFGNSLYRQNTLPRIPVCIPNGAIQRVSSVFKERNGFGVGRLVEYQLSLAAKLPSRSIGVVQQVANVAFSIEIQPSGIFRYTDIRPYARNILASFGKEATPYAQKAYSQISIENSMGTGAAQIAAAGGHPNALFVIKNLMEEALSATPTSQPIPRETRNRLYELAWALYYGGTEASNKNVYLIHKIMSRKVESWAPPFGIISAHPKNLCYLLAKIEGNLAIERYEYCVNKDHPFEQ